jgi:acyl carrier protein
MQHEIPDSYAAHWRFDPPGRVEMLTDLTSDWDRGLDGPIGAKTRFVDDLGFDSVDDVQVAIAIEE